MIQFSYLVVYCVNLPAGLRSLPVAESASTDDAASGVRVKQNTTTVLSQWMSFGWVLCNLNTLIIC